MSSALTEQLCVREGAGYDEVFLSGQKDPNTSSEERSLSSTSPSSRDEVLEMDRPEDDEGVNGVEPPIQSIIGPDGLREFIMLPIWTVNDFTFTIKESYFKTLRGKYQIPYNIPLRLPYKSKKCYYEDIEGVKVY